MRVLPVTWQRWRSHRYAENPTLRANFTALSCMEPELLPIEVLRCVNMDFRAFCYTWPWPWLDYLHIGYELTCIFWRRNRRPTTNFLGQGSRKLSYLHTLHVRLRVKLLPRLFVGGKNGPFWPHGVDVWRSRHRTSLQIPKYNCLTVGLNYTLCLKKNIPDVFTYNSRKHWWIFIIFGRNVTGKASNHMLLYFSTSPN